MSSLLVDIYAAHGDDDVARALISCDLLGVPAPDGLYGLLSQRSPEGGFRAGRRICRLCRKGTDTADPRCGHCGGRLEPYLGLNGAAEWQRMRSPRRAAAWVLAAWALISRDDGINYSELAREAGTSRNTARDILRTLRSLPAIAAPAPLDGPVEVDEAIIDTGGQQAIVALATHFDPDQHRITAVRLQRIPGLDAGSLTDFVSRHVARKGLVYTDESPLYSSLAERGYTHETRTKATSVDASRVAVAGPRFVAKTLADWLLCQQHGAVPVALLQPYLDEFSFRFSLHRATRGEMSIALFQLLSALNDWWAGWTEPLLASRTSRAPRRELDPHGDSS